MSVRQVRYSFDPESSSRSVQNANAHVKDDVLRGYWDTGEVQSLVYKISNS